MRERKYRVWDENSDAPRMIYSDEFANLNWFFKSVSIKNIMDWTGLQDKNDKEIYEGDICKNNMMIYEIIFALGCFQCVYADKRFATHIYLIAKDLDIIGNIFENKELL